MSETITIRMPDGYLMRNIPKGTPRESIDAAYKRYLERNPVEEVAGGVVEAVGGAAESALSTVADTANWVMGGTPTGPDYLSGVEDYDLHREFGMRDNDDEREALLTTKVGKDNWYRDNRGEYLIKPEGIAALGMDPAKFHGRPVEMTGAGLRGTDVERWASSAWGPMIGGTFGGLAGGLAGGVAGLPLGPGAVGTGMMGAAGGAGIGATVGKGVQELWEHLTNRNQQTASDVGKDMTVEGAYGAIPIPLAQAGVGGVAKKLTAPYAKRLLPENAALANEAAQMGVQPAIHQVVPDAGLVGRSAGIAKRIFPWSARERQNIQALQNETARLMDDMPLSKSADEAGRDLRSALQEGQESFRSWAQKDLYDPLRARVGGGDAPVVPTKGIQATAAELIDSLPVTADGKRMTLGKQEYGLLKDFAALPENQSLDQVWKLRDRLREMRKAPAMQRTIPTSVIDKLDSSLLNAMGDIPEHGPAARATARIYAKASNLRKDKLFDRMLRDPGEVGGISDRDMIDRAFTPKGGETIARLWKNIPPDRKAGVQRGAFEKLVTEVTGGTESIQDFISAGPKLLTVLQKYERPTLVQMFGSKKTNDLFKLGRVMELNSRKNKDYGALVAASIAARPIHNIGKIGQFRALNNLYESPTGLKMFTEGLDFMSKKGQATKLIGKTLSDLAIHGSAGTGEGADKGRGASYLKSMEHFVPPPETELRLPPMMSL